MSEHNSTTETSFNFEDFIQIVIGSSLLVAPIAFSEEAWNMSKSLPLTNVVFLMILSIFFIGLYVFQGIFSGDIKHRIPVYISRIFIDYSITLFVVFIILIALNKIPFDTPIIAIKRVIIIGFPASLVGVVLDGMDKE